MAIEPVLKQLNEKGGMPKMRGSFVSTGGARASHAFGVPGERRLTLNCSGNVEVLVQHFDLLIDHLPRKPIDRGVYPVMLFTFDNESLEISFSSRASSALRHRINQ